MMDMEDIKKVLPHRNHFLLVDAVTEIGENSASGYHEVKKFPGCADFGAYGTGGRFCFHQ